MSFTYKFRICYKGMVFLPPKFNYKTGEDSDGQATIIWETNSLDDLISFMNKSGMDITITQSRSSGYDYILELNDER